MLAFIIILLAYVYSFAAIFNNILRQFCTREMWQMMAALIQVNWKMTGNTWLFKLITDKF